MTSIAYFVHDVNDPAVERRVRMFHAAGATVVVLGFRRRDGEITTLAGASVVHLGRTEDSKLTQRAIAVFRNLIRPRRYLDAVGDADIMIGRTLEALALAARARASNRSARLVYECLDIHRTLLGTSPLHRGVQMAERKLLSAIDLLIVSSPAFVREYFSRLPSLKAPTLLLENKLLMLDDAPTALPAPPAGPPWTIGWFGNLRCSRTFELLADASATMGGKLRILIAGRPSPAVFTGFEDLVSTSPHMHFLGPYGVDDLASLYAQCHFAWAIDYFEEGLNSSWLLPNRLYEASNFGAVPIALSSVETGRWLRARSAGLLLERDEAASLIEQLGSMDARRYLELRSAVEAIPHSDLIATVEDCRELLSAVVADE